MDLLHVVKLEPRIQKIYEPEWGDQNIHCSMLRLDEIDDSISGNKLFKLYYFLKQAASEKKQVVTFGGAWSNHLAATASACKLLGIKCVGIVRGDQPSIFSSTLNFCMEKKMQLHFVSRSLYDDLKDGRSNTLFSSETNIVIPEGGYSVTGAQGAALIRKYFNNKNFTHACISIGTATTFAGLLANENDCTYIGFSAIKNMTDINERINFLKGENQKLKYEIINAYHFGGYAKYTDELIKFMNTFYLKHNIPLDFIYTAKMMYGVSQMAGSNYFSEGSNILCIHTGGLQGNNGLPEHALVF